MSGEWESIASAAPGPISQEDTREIEESEGEEGRETGAKPQPKNNILPPWTSDSAR